ncbi:hypothetical protein MESS4_370039 [Mesorhizobium sp. STM 4661]|nr:hypothetical protein MESS4_370039 [Mesorhizobium sp. STM 4661]
MHVVAPKPLHTFGRHALEILVLGREARAIRSLFLPGVDFPGVAVGVGEIEAEGVPFIDLRRREHRDALLDQFGMDRVDDVGAVHPEGRHHLVNRPLGAGGGKADMLGQVFALPQSERGSRGVEVGKAFVAAPQAKADPFVEFDRAVEIANQKADIGYRMIEAKRHCRSPEIGLDIQFGISARA